MSCTPRIQPLPAAEIRIAGTPNVAIRTGALTRPSTHGVSVATATCPSTGASRKPVKPIAVPAERGTGPAVEPHNRLELDTTVAALREAGYEFSADLDGALPAMLVAVEGDASSTAYWVGLHNFRVITRYNRSVKYALAAFELGEAIGQRHRELAEVLE